MRANCLSIFHSLKIFYDAKKILRLVSISEAQTPLILFSFFQIFHPRELILIILFLVLIWSFLIFFLSHMSFQQPFSFHGSTTQEKIQFINLLDFDWGVCFQIYKIFLCWKRHHTRHKILWSINAAIEWQIPAQPKIKFSNHFIYLRVALAALKVSNSSLHHKSTQRLDEQEFEKGELRLST